MDNFEKRMLLQYMIEMLPEADFSRYSADEFCEDVSKNLRIKFSEKFLACKKFSKEYREYCKVYKEKFKNKLAQIKPVKTLTEKKIDIISDIYDLGKVEKQILIFLVLRETNEEINNFTQLFRDDGAMLPFRKLFLRIKSRNIIHEVYNDMYDKGILNRQDYSHDKELNEKLQSLFYYPEIKTERQIRETILGEVAAPELKWKDFEYISKERDIIARVVKSAVRQRTKGVNILLYGDVGTGKTQFSKMITDKLGLELYSVNADINNTEATRRERISDLCSKQTILSKFSNSCILFDEAEDIFNRYTDSKAFVNNLLESAKVPVFWTTNDIYDVDPAVLRRMTFAVRFEKHSEEVRLGIWKNILKKNNMPCSPSKLIELNRDYDISPALITNAVKSTKLINGTQEDFECFVDNVAQVVSKRKSVKKEEQNNIEFYNEEIVNTDISIKTLTRKIKESGKLNFSLCLYGEPGTGKSQYARYLANQLGVEVVFKRASDLMSKWVGGTEQNIAEAFAEAKKKRAMLIFDEADSFLQSRTNANHSWEVSQVNEMLTWMESHKYPFVCTTNLLDTLDEASLRRFTFKIQFNFMTKEQVNKAVEHFFGIKNTNIDIKGLTAGDFSTVQKKADFLGIKDLSELEKMLYDEVKVKQSKELKNTIGF